MSQEDALRAELHDQKKQNYQKQVILMREQRTLRRVRELASTWAETGALGVLKYELMGISTDNMEAKRRFGVAILEILDDPSYVSKSEIENL